MTQPDIETQSSGPLANILLIRQIDNMLIIMLIIIWLQVILHTVISIR